MIGVPHNRIMRCTYTVLAEPNGMSNVYLQVVDVQLKQVMHKLLVNLLLRLQSNFSSTATSTHKHPPTHTYLHTHLYTHTHILNIHTNTYIHTHIYMHLYTCLHTYTHIHTPYTYTHLHTYAPTHTHRYIYSPTHAYSHVQTQAHRPTHTYTLCPCTDCSLWQRPSRHPTVQEEALPPTTSPAQPPPTRL